VDQPLRWTDNHCHLDITAAGDGRDGNGGGDVAASEGDANALIDSIVAAAVDAGVSRLITVGIDAATSRVCQQVASRHYQVWSTAGVHPHEARQVHAGRGVIAGSHGLEAIDELLPDSRVVAVGECGLDYHYDHSPRPIQREVFAAQIELAHRHRLPLVVHTREAWDDTLHILERERVPEPTVIHCFTGGAEEARRCLALGCYLSFSGIVTFKAADDVRAAAQLCPLDRLLVETDSPFLAPVPHRGRPNQPAYVGFVGEAIAAVRGATVDAVAAATWQNADAVYRFS
jgi:TatD DNase family protein